jgi:uncharacterized glyoxalase superfamily protein PhnB
MSQIVPYLTYADAPAAIDFLCRAFGFVERLRYPMPDGRIGHAELVLGDAALMLASSWEGFGLVSPQALPALHAQVHCTIDDVDAHCRRAERAGAIIAAAPQRQHGARMYRALDLEGHRWMFVQALSPTEAARGDDGGEP